MKEFKDDQGRPWLVALTCASAARVRDLVTIEIKEEVEQPDGTKKSVGRVTAFDLVDTETVAKTLEVLRGKFTTIGEVLYAILLHQVEEKKLTKEQFLDGLRGDALDAAAKALESELVDFFPFRLRKMVALMAAKMDDVASELIGQAEATLEAATTESLLGQSGMPSGRPPASLASTQESGPSASSSSPAITV